MYKTLLFHLTKFSVIIQLLLNTEVIIVLNFETDL